MTSESFVWLIDSSALIRIKIAVPGKLQWKLFRHLEELVEQGRLTFPKQVRVEVCEMAHPDGPGIWADGVFDAVKHPKEADPHWLRVVMSSPAAAVVDQTKTREDADPHVLALALQLIDAGLIVRIATDDRKSNALRKSMADACDDLQIPWCDAHAFLTEVGFPPTAKESSAE